MKIDFEMTHDGMMFRDAIVLPDDHGLSAEQIEQIKQKRFAGWLVAIQPVEGE